MERDQGKKFKERRYDLMVTANCESKKEKELIEEVIEKEATVNTEDVGERTIELLRIEVGKESSQDFDLEKRDGSEEKFDISLTKQVGEILEILEAERGVMEREEGKLTEEQLLNISNLGWKENIEFCGS